MSQGVINKHQIHFSNVNGLKSKFSTLTDNVGRFPHTACMAFVEAKIGDSPPTLAPNLIGFVSHSLPFSSLSSGIVCYSAVPCRSLSRLSCTAEDGSMVLFSQLRVNGVLFCLGVVYIRPQVVVSDFQKIIRAIDRVIEHHSTVPLLLLGDFNCRHPQFGDNVKPSTNSNKLVFLEWSWSYGSQHSESPWCSYPW